MNLLQSPIRLRISENDDGDAHASSRIHRRLCHHLVNGGGMSDGDETFATASENDSVNGYSQSGRVERKAKYHKHHLPS